MGTFQLIRCDERSRARVGILTTPHNQIPTPVFMPVGTQGTVKGLAPDRLKGMGVTVLLGNSYHLHLRPGEQLIREAGGLHRFMSWDGSILTDCGGFQVFSLSKLVRIEEEGVTFRSHLDGSLHRFTPEVSMQIQNDIGSDIVMALDQCVGYPTSEFQQKSAMLRTLSWAKRCRDFFHSEEQQLFGIVQGGMIPEFRQYSAEKTVEIGFDGFAIGGLSVGEP
ncbi:MAG: tRNA guanosine(34) transglycosylase Tgt, partial [Atribacterota bacterium]